MLADLEKSSFSNIEQQSLEFVKYTLDPWVVRWEQSMCRALLMESEKPIVCHGFQEQVVGSAFASNDLRNSR